MLSPRPKSGSWAIALSNRVVDEVDDRGHLQVFLPAPSLCLSLVEGHLSQRMAHKWIDVIDPYFRRGVIFETFHDWFAMDSYESSARRSLTTWVVANHRNITGAQFLVGSKLVAMGVSAASLATTLVGLSMVAHTTRPPFDQALDQAVKRHTRA